MRCLEKNVLSAADIESEMSSSSLTGISALTSLKVDGFIRRGFSMAFLLQTSCSEHISGT